MTKSTYLIPALQVLEANRCVGGIALVDGRKEVHCTHSSTGEVTKAGIYRACVQYTGNGIVITAAQPLGAE